MIQIVEQTCEAFARQVCFHSRAGAAQPRNLFGWLEPALAARLSGAANSRFRLVANTLSEPERERREQDLTALRSALGEEQFSACWRAGEDMSQEQIRVIVFEKNAVERDPGLDSV